MKFQGAVIKEQGVTFAIVIVKKTVVDNATSARKAIMSFQPIFSNIPIVLMAQDSRGTPTYYGRKDIVGFLANIPLSVIPWKEYASH
ncbi:MAG: hypothetical protein FVQ80_10430 [Planctomycetes bacterium]|nr:hypothetical protein [Planctomycetota bacterium]